MLNIESLHKSFRENVILHNLTFTVNPGEIIGLVGENGAGKSTLLHILATISKPSEGSISLNDLSYTTERKKIRKLIGYVPQDIAVWEDLTVEENMVFFEKLSWVNQTKEELRNLCQEMKLYKWKEPVNTLSGGMKRKLNLAISLIHHPKVLLLDEPTVGIDLKSRKEIGTYLQKQAVENELMIIYTSHDMDEINELCNRVICIGKDPFYKDMLLNSGKEIISF
ncbi:ATP-binding cassette domain-containing protein [Ornithinibacillus sp. L9]|uniref:ATP-binding cassette domain-containing protein n=1 Tax=Ornithinibacillus caprae TaxID=2678566 RepID=A0A6N8FGQ1_9BACI|nr:ABC transporter ATP-binding protein [Ornithinibacillus caprae]MUK86909.1 ATP-binding cassette domain-containing protein [Ornithinibacillus caprae]